MCHANNDKRKMTEGIELPNQGKIRTFRRTRKLFKTKLYCRNFIKGINVMSVLLIRYFRPFLKWTREELQQIDQKTRRLMTIHTALHPWDEIDKLYVRKERVFTSIEDSIDTSIRPLEDYIKKSKERLITSTRNNANNTRINRTTIIRKN